MFVRRFHNLPNMLRLLFPQAEISGSLERPLPESIISDILNLVPLLREEGVRQIRLMPSMIIFVTPRINLAVSDLQYAVIGSEHGLLPLPLIIGEVYPTSAATKLVMDTIKPLASRDTLDILSAILRAARFMESRTRLIPILEDVLSSLSGVSRVEEYVPKSLKVERGIAFREGRAVEPFQRLLRDAEKLVSALGLERGVLVARESASLPAIDLAYPHVRLTVTDKVLGLLLSPQRESYRVAVPQLDYEMFVAKSPAMGKTIQLAVIREEGNRKKVVELARRLEKALGVKDLARQVAKTLRA